jgi:hypothetical protein
MANTLRGALNEVIDKITSVDEDLVTGNIKAGATILGVAGKTEVVDTTEATVPIAATTVLSGKKGYVNGSLVTGSASATALAVKISTLDTAKKVVTIYLNQIVTAVGDAAALKAGITIATDGTTYSALGASDTVAITGGSTIVVTFDSALSTATNKIKIAAGTVKDVFSINNAEAVTGTIDASA